MGASGLGLVRNIFSGVLFGQGREVIVYSVVNLLAATAVVYAILQKSFLRILTGRTITLIGRMSYGGYLYHALILWLICTLAVGPLPVALPQRLALFAVAWTLTLLVAYVSFRWFEAPILSWAKHAHSVPQSRSLRPDLGAPAIPA